MNNWLQLKASEMYIQRILSEQRVKSTPNLLTLQLSWSEFMRVLGDIWSTVISTTIDNKWHQMMEIVKLKWAINLSLALSKWMSGCTQAVLVAGDGSVILRHLILVCPFMLAFSKLTFFFYYSFSCHCWWWTTVVQYLTYNMLCHAALLLGGRFVVVLKV